MEEHKIIRFSIITLPIFALLWVFTNSIVWGVIMIFVAIIINELLSQTRFNTLLMAIRKIKIKEKKSGKK